MRIFEKKCNGCKRTLVSSYFFRKDKVHARCNDCSLNSSIKKNICEVCGIRACFNIKGLTWGKFCNVHREVGMVNVKDKTCENSGCNKRPVFNFESETKGKFCKDHKEIGMVNIKDKTCENSGCNKRPVFNFKGETKGLYCKEHKKEGMVDVNNKTCRKEGCNKQPIFNIEGESKGIYCKEHKDENMINVKDKTCEKIGCKKQPIYNLECETKGKFCKYHKEEGMINIRDKRCNFEGCSKIPNFNYEGESSGKYCGVHKKEGMVNIKHKTCDYNNCNKQPSFNYEGENGGKYCGVHKEPGMVNVKDKICEYKGCKVRAFFGYCNRNPSHCFQHKFDYMISKPKRKCVGNDEEECKEDAIYGKSEPLHCEEHRFKDDICWLIKKCNNCGRDKELLNKEELCIICCDKPFYEESKRLNKIKESIMVRYLRQNITEGNEILADKIIDSNCNLYRPDILYDCGTHIVVIECDENQHKNYQWESCSLNKSLEHMEEKRMYEIMIAYGLPAIFIRWNPDIFKVNGIINKKYNNNIRLKMLVKWINYCFKFSIESGVMYKKLFYDDYEEEDMSFKVINENELI